MPPKASARRYFWLLAVPFAGLLFPGFYARAEPALFGLPFFYWYQSVWLFVSSVLTAFVYVRSR